jgi:ubiquinone/menaquinone biosynthesis C-methylase UbiE/uncharacterized protein YbaR (Trm112 family)
MLQNTVNESFLQSLRCPRCAEKLFQGFPQKLKCTGCGSEYQVENGVPILWGTGSRSSQLEGVDYDALQPINTATIKHVGTQWKELLNEVCEHPCDMLEIGAGTGILTEGLLDHADLRSIVVSDVSLKFTLALAARLSTRPAFKGAVVCDANETVFAESSFDVIIGRSVLHHLVDYPIVLRNIRSFLRSGGSAVFFEPVLEGKSVISLACALILQADAASPNPILPKEDVKAINTTLRHQTKHAWYPQTRSELVKLEDKYIFKIAEMKKLGLEAGYSRVEFLDRQQSDFSYWSYIQHTLRMAGVGVKTLQRFSWIGNAIRDSYFCSTNNIPTPMGFFVFYK